MIRLVPDKGSHDTVEALEALLERAKSGEIIGMAYVCMLQRRGYIADDVVMELKVKDLLNKGEVPCA